MTTRIARHSRAPAARAMPAPMRSVMPVCVSAAEITNTEATMIAGSLANPESASFGVRMPVAASASRVSIAATSMRIRSLMNRISVTATIGNENELFGGHGGPGPAILPARRGDGLIALTSAGWPPIRAFEQMFPVLTPAQVERVRRHGRVRPIAAGERAVRRRLRGCRLLRRPGRAGGHRPARRQRATRGSSCSGAGQFTGEVTLLARRRPLVRAQVVEAGEAIELSRDALLALVQTDSELSEILMRAFILRRVNLIARASATSC